MGGAITGDREGMDEEKEGGSVSTPREVPSNFSAVVAPMRATAFSASRCRLAECRDGALFFPTYDADVGSLVGMRGRWPSIDYIRTISGRALNRCCRTARCTTHAHTLTDAQREMRRRPNHISLPCAGQPASLLCLPSINVAHRRYVLLPALLAFHSASSSSHCDFTNLLRPKIRRFVSK